MLTRKAFTDEFAYEVVVVAGEIECLGARALTAQTLYQYLGLRSFARTIRAVYYDEFSTFVHSARK